MSVSPTFSSPPASPSPAKSKCPPSPAAPALEPAAGEQVGVTDLQVSGGVVRPDGAVTVSGRAHYLTGTVSAAVPAGTQLWVVTNPSSGGYYLQAGPVAVAADRRFSANFNLGVDDRPAAGPNDVRLVQVADSTGAYFASCHSTTGKNPALPGALPWHEVGLLVVHKV